MFTEKDFQCKLVNAEEVKGFVQKHGEFAAVCYNSDPTKGRVIGKHCLQSGHFSGSRHLYFVFELKCIPRFLIDQLVRHEIGVVKNVQSLRYVTKDSLNIYAAPEIACNDFLVNMFKQDEVTIAATMQSYRNFVDQGNKERDNEIVRSLCPIGVESACSFACNIEALINLANKRLCNRAELPIQHLTKMMCDAVVAVEPLYKPFLVPQCVKLGYCPEGKSCKADK